MQVAALDLRPGYLVNHQGRMATVVWWNILRNDRRAFVQMRIKDLQNGRVTELKEHTDSKWEVLDKEEVDLSHSYRDSQEEVFYRENGDEVRCGFGVLTASPDAAVHNPAFDVTPARLIRAIVSDRGVHMPPYDFTSDVRPSAAAAS